jgi:hypothetical protein
MNQSIKWAQAIQTSNGLTCKGITPELASIADKTGRTILSIERVNSDTSIVLATWRGEFVTWSYSDDCAFYYGHYFQTDLMSAITDYQERLGR